MMEDKNPTVFLYGNCEPFCWKAYKVNVKDKVTYSQLLKLFIEEYQKERKVEVDIKSIRVAVLGCITFKEINVKNLDSEISSEREFAVLFESLSPEDKRVFCRRGVSHDFLNLGLYFSQKKLYRCARKFLTISGIFGLKELIKFFSQLRDHNNIQRCLEKVRYYYPNDLEIEKIAAECYENSGEKEKALQIYSDNKDKLPIFNVAYERLKLTSKAKYSVDNIVHNAIDTTPIMSRELLFECALLYIRNKQYKEAIDLALQSIDLFSDFIRNFCLIPNVSKNIVNALTNSSLPPMYVASLALKIHKHGFAPHARKIAKHLFETFKNNFFCALIYVSMLFKCYKYEKLVNVVSSFIRSLPGYFYNFDTNLIKKLLESTQLFEGKLLYSESPPTIKKEDINEDDKNYFLYMLMIISLVFFLIGDIKFFKNFTRIFENYLLPSSKDYIGIANIPHMFYNIWLMHQSAYKILPNVSNINNSDSNLLVIGDVHAISCCNLRIDIRKKQYHITSLPIENLSIWDLRPESKKSSKVLFYRFVQRANQFPALLLVLGTRDCEIAIPKLCSKNFSKSQITIPSFVQIYMTVLEEISQFAPDSMIIVHSAFSRYPWSAAIVRLFNEELRKYVKDKYKFVYPFPANTANNFFATPGIENGIPDSRYPDRLRHLFKTICS
ncbi:hypothetical protein TRFO_18879 [Tritrichomonas foetus]|uniref:Uncharacterized protein n=1 Tax=Tritrichomonas foetus TaxID=1144522 RepID=A0A1J4KKF7_9EUKA|nr:hypothetical protein TRFO_18879 [Tritrichomonas foetus]|eukprot:OHT11618.1 hypothetical protein TRFO_18879 [Tritrichomonas foetus]